MSNDFATYQMQAIDAAKQLHYGKSVINQIEDATTSSEIARIMINARHNKFDSEKER